MDSGYWLRFSVARLRRRRALQAAGIAGLGGAALALFGCSGGGNDGDSSAAPSAVLGGPGGVAGLRCGGGQVLDRGPTACRTSRAAWRCAAWLDSSRLRMLPVLPALLPAHLLPCAASCL